MANEYTELEQLVNDVTSLDTARMTLRWALERLQNIEKEKADLKKNLTLAEETAKRLQVKEASLTDSYSSRYKTLEEKEDFYTKLEATMSLLGEGKLDIQQLLKKEAKLDSLRHSLEAEYADKFEELDRSQRSIIERWNARLLDVESQYAGRLCASRRRKWRPAAASWRRSTWPRSARPRKITAS
jgi:DNA repair ATPase RecN